MINIRDLERETATGGVKTVHWEIILQDGDYEELAYGSFACEPDPTAEDFVAFEDLTKEIVISWIEAEVDVQSVMDSLQARIDRQKEPVIASGVPW